MTGYDISFGYGLLAALKVGAVNALSVVTRPIHTTKVILGMRQEKGVPQMLAEELSKYRPKEFTRG